MGEVLRWLGRIAVGLLVLVLVLAGGAGSAHAGARSAVPQRFPPGPWLTDIRIQGPEADGSGAFPHDPALPALSARPDARGRRVDARQTAFLARAALSHPLPEWWQSVPGVRRFTPVPSASIEVLEADAWNLRLWFMDRGWLDCTVRLEVETDTSIWGRWLHRRVPDAARRATYVVDTGERWTVRDVEIDGLDTVHRPLRRALRQAVEVEPGAYDGDARARTEAAFVAALSARGFSHPYVASVLVPHANTKSVTVLFHLDPGQRATFGALEVVGLSAVDQERISRRVATRVPEGERWDASRLVDIEAALDRLPSFAQVEVAPGEMAADRTVPVQVTVSEADPGGWSPIVEIASDPTFYALEVGARYRSDVVGAQLATFEASAATGYRTFPVPFGPDTFWGNHGPVGRLDVGSEVFVRPLAGVSLVVEAEGDLEPVRANNMLTAAVRGGVRLRSRSALEVTITPELALWQSFAWPAQTELWSAWFVEPGDPPLPPMQGRHRTAFRPFAPGAMVRLGLHWVETDQPMLPTQGGELHVDAVPYGVAGTDPFWRVELSARRFVRLGSPRWVLVPRLDAGVFRFHDPRVASVPQLRFRLGGGTSLRGFGVGQANPPGWDGGPNDLRIGGNVLALASTELQFEVWPRLHVFTFVDAGRTWESVTDRVDPESGVIEPGVRLSTLLPSAGLGVALPTPVGRAALSGAIRLREETELLNPPTLATIHFVLVHRY